MGETGVRPRLDRAAIRSLLLVGLLGAALTGAGDFLLGFGEETRGTGLASQIMANAANLTDAQLIWGGLLGMLGLFLEGIGFFAICRLMADAAPGYARVYRVGIFGYIWLAPIGCHMNVGVLNIAYKYLLGLDPELAEQVGDKMILAFSVPVWGLLVLFWAPMLILQFLAFSKGYTPYPKHARWFHMLVGALPVLVISMLIGTDNRWGPAIGTTFLSVGNGLTFAGLLATLPGEERFAEFRSRFPETRNG